jgi:Guanosine polyphosphate pyrophosphohydrolases/synthetases
MITFKNEKPLKEYDAVSLAEMLRADFVEKYPAPTVQRLQNAIQVASYLHRNDVRRGARSTSVSPPYIEHPLRVALRALRRFQVADPNVIIAAVLHDTVEDHALDFVDFEGVRATDKGYEDRVALGYLSQQFGFEVAKFVELVSNPPITPGTPKAEKIAAYQAHVAKVVNLSSEALIIKVSDFIDNAGSLHHHYSYGDPKVGYFLDRYEPLLEVYRGALNTGNHEFWVAKVRERLDDVESQFDKFRSVA